MLKDAALNFEQSGLHVFSSSFLEGQKGITKIVPLYLFYTLLQAETVLS